MKVLIEGKEIDLKNTPVTIVYDDDKERMVFANKVLTMPKIKGPRIFVIHDTSK